MHRSLITPGQLQARLSDPRWLVVDCRYDPADPGAGYHAYLERHIPGAVYAHLDDDLSGPSGAGGGRHPLPGGERLVELFSRLGVDESTEVIAYDDAYGSIAGRLWWLLRYMGHERAAVLDGGWTAWVEAGCSTDAAPARGAPRRFRGEPIRDMLVMLDDVPAAPLLVDSRDPSRYRGEIEPLDPVAGHIPGARNRFWKANLDEGGRFLPAATLRREFDSLYDGMDPAAVTFYCGSGVTACHNVLAAAHAGLPLPRLYAGSWSEWCADPARPVARGNE
jgi:thiosulfate/3-mercaptopyruvate sulfurtransferase